MTHYSTVPLIFMLFSLFTERKLVKMTTNGGSFTMQTHHGSTITMQQIKKQFGSDHSTVTLFLWLNCRLEEFPTVGLCMRICVECACRFGTFPRFLVCVAAGLWPKLLLSFL